MQRNLWKSYISNQIHFHVAESSQQLVKDNGAMGNSFSHSVLDSMQASKGYELFLNQLIHLSEGPHFTVTQEGESQTVGPV